MIEQGLVSIREAAKQLGVRRETVGDLVGTLGISTYPMTNGRAKGLNSAALKRLRKAIGKPARASA